MSSPRKEGGGVGGGKVKNWNLTNELLIFLESPGVILLGTLQWNCIGQTVNEEETPSLWRFNMGSALHSRLFWCSTLSGKYYRSLQTRLILLFHVEEDKDQRITVS